MDSLILRYETDPKIYGFKNLSKTYHCDTNGFKVSEVFTINPNYRNLREGLGDYFVRIEIEINDESQLLDIYPKVSNLAKSLDKAWMYACGHPLSKRHFSFSAPYIEHIDGSIEGWSNNIKEIKEKMHRNEWSLDINVEHIHWAYYNEYPLSNAMNIIDSLSHATEQLNTLVDFHYLSHKVEDGYSMCFFLAKGLELVRSLLPGKPLQVKEKNLSDISEHLYSSLNKLYDLSNNRFEVRHIVRNLENLTLHPRMTNEEFKIFKHDSDLVIRSVVCSNLGIDLLIAS